MDNEFMPKTIEEIIAENVRSLMEKTPGLNSNPKLAKKAKIGTGTVSRIINAETSAGIDVIDSIAKAFGLTASALMKEGLLEIKEEAIQLSQTVESLSASGKMTSAEIKAMNEMLKAREHK